MRGFQCYLYHKLKDDTYIINTVSACYAGIRHLHLRDDLLEPNIVYIDKYKEPETEKYIELIIGLVNEITPCSIQDGYIKFQLLETYDQSLILLNFIRNLWNKTEPLRRYSEEFFEILSKEILEDPLSRMMSANKKACSKAEVWGNLSYPPGHSNCHTEETLAIKTVEELLSYKGGSTKQFLTNK